MKPQIRVIFAMSLAAMAALPALAQVTGSVTTNYLPVWKSGSSIGNSVLYQNGNNVGIDTSSPVWALDVNGHINTASGVFDRGPKRDHSEPQLGESGGGLSGASQQPRRK
jgi:hypothetical protein